MTRPVMIAATLLLRPLAPMSAGAPRRRVKMNPTRVARSLMLCAAPASPPTRTGPTAPSRGSHLASRRPPQRARHGLQFGIAAGPQTDRRRTAEHRVIAVQLD